ncbi:Uncharacterized WD repeat-containing protein C3H5.08c [Linum grandiflorum]
MNLTSTDTSSSVSDSDSESLQLGAEIDNNRVMEDNGGGAVLRSCDSEDQDGFWSDDDSNLSRSTSCQSAEARESFQEADTNFVCKIRNLDDGREFVVEELDQDGMFGKIREVGSKSNQSISLEEFQRNVIGFSPLIQRLLRRYADDARNNMNKKKSNNSKKSWLKKKKKNPGSGSPRNFDKREYKHYDAMPKVKVHTHRKKTKQLSSVYVGQEFLAHKGAILTMKFSLDGKYLATGGEDGVVNVWKVIEEDSRLDDQFDVSTCVVLPQKVFRVLEKPLHEFKGHSGEVLDLSWSNQKYLLSSSDDNTVRLWRVGCDKCLKVFHHNNYVTCVQFNPVDEDYFITGSVDGKVRIWEVSGCHVVCYTDIREIVTAIAYRPGGEGAVVGTMSGNCIFFEIIDNKMRHDAVVCSQGRTKLPGKRITSFEFSPSDPSRVIVTSADSLVRVLCSTNVICKFRVSRLRIATNQMHATFTSDGKSVISTSDDSNVYIWNYDKQEKPSSRAKLIRSYESFVSPNASVSIPWRGIENAPGGRVWSPRPSSGQNHHKNIISPPDCFSITRGFLLDSLSKGAATWPEENLPRSKPVKTESKFLKNAKCHSMSNSQMWGMVLVTAGWDGRIRTYLNYGLPQRV